MINNGIKLSGKLIGIHINRKDGTVEHNWLRNPVHNTIVQSGIKHLLTYNGTQSIRSCLTYYTELSTLCPFFGKYIETVSYSSSTIGPHYGVFWQMGIGTGTSITQSSMTDLEQPVQSSYVKRAVVAGIPYTGTRLIDKGHFEYRITHTSVEVENDCTISEFALYGLINSSTRVMFCRILIPSELRPQLSLGESVSFTYSLDWYIPDDNNGRIEDIGLLDSIGNPLNFGASTQFFMNMQQNTSYGQFFVTSSNKLYGGVTLSDETGEDVIGPYYSTYDVAYCYIMLPWKYFCDANVSSPTNTWVYSNVGCAFTSNKSLPTYGGNNSQFVGNAFSGATYIKYNNSTSLKGSRNVSNYIDGTNYRDYSIRISNISANPINIYYLRHCGMDYRFFKVENGEDVYQPIIIASGKTLELNFRWSVTTGNSGVH